MGIDFNLVGLQYLDFGPAAMLTTNPQDTRALLYSEWSYQHEGSYTGSRSQTFYVATVPEPASWGHVAGGGRSGRLGRPATQPAVGALGAAPWL